jgi:hypothetical protein
MAYALFIVMAIFALASMVNTGEGSRRTGGRYA